MDVEARLASGVPLPPCTSSTRRVDIGGLPPRAPVAVDLPPGERSSQRRGRRCDAKADATRPRSRGRRRALDRIRRALASGAALKAVLGPDETELRQQAEAMDRTDPRLEWLLTQATALAAGEREDARVRGPSRDARDAARRAQRASAARQRRLPRGAVGGAARHRGRTVPRRRWAEHPRVDRSGRRGAQLRVLPPPGALRPAVETLDGGAAHRAAGSHRPPHPGRDRLFPSGVGHRRRRRAAVRAARALPRADGRSRAAARPRRGRAGGDRARSATRRCPMRRSSSSSPPRRRRARGSTRRRISSCIAIPIAPSWDRRFSPASRRASTR